METRLLFLIVMTFSFIKKGECELNIKPVGSYFIKSLNGSVVFTCEFVSDGGGDDDDMLPVWRDKNDEIIKSEGRRYVENDFGVVKLYITSIQEADVGRYKCSRGSESRLVHLHVYKDISFDDAPKVQYFDAGDVAMVRCVVSGVPSPRVSWRVGGRRVSPLDSKYIPTNDGLKILNVTENNTGTYTCRAEVDVDGRYEDRRISVVVKHAPRMIEDMGEVVAMEGSFVMLTCKVRGVPVPTMEFFKVLPNNNTDEISGHSQRITNDSLIFNEVNKSDEGHYRCVATNELGSEHLHGFLKVLVPPSVVLPDNVTATLGSKVTVSCRGLGDPVPHVSFIRKMDGRDMSIEDDDDDEQPDKKKLFSNQSNGFNDLMIRDLSLNDSNVYTCVAESLLGRSAKDVKLIVQYGPQFEGDMTSLVHGWKGQRVNMTCNVRGEPKIKVQWFKGHELISHNELFHIFESPMGSVLQVSLDESRKGMYGLFVCRGFNDLGMNDFNFTLREANVPNKPDIRVVRLRSGDVVVNITNDKTADEFDAVVSYVLQVFEGNDVTVNLSVPVKSDDRDGLNFTTTMATITRLLHNTTYIFLVRPVNRVGAGDEVNIKLTTPALGVPDVVKVNVTSLESNSVTLTWDSPYSGGSNIIGYIIGHRKVRPSNGDPSYKPQSTWHDHSLPCNIDFPPPTTTMVSTRNHPKHPNETSYHILLPCDRLTFDINDLQPSTFYQIKVVAFNSIGQSEPHQDFFVQTSGGNLGFLPYFLKTPNSSMIIILVSTLIIALVVIIDVTCYVINGCGITMCCCVFACGRSKKQASPRMNKVARRDGGGHIKSSKREATIEAGESSDETLDVVVNNNNTMETDALPPEIKQEMIDDDDDDDDEGGDVDGKTEERHPLMENVDTRGGRGGDDDELLPPPPPPPLSSLAPIMHAEKTDLIAPKNRRSIMNSGDIRWKDVVHELEAQLGVKNPDHEESKEEEDDRYLGPSSPKWRHT